MQDEIEILKNSEILKIANLACFSTKSNIYIYSNNINNSKVFETQKYKSENSFKLKGFSNKSDLLYEYVNKDNLIIESINLKTYYEFLEVLSVRQNNELNISINITDNKDNNAVISISKNSVSFIFNEKDASVKIYIDLKAKDVIKYQERNKNQTFNLKLTKEKRKANISAYNTINSKIEEKTILSNQLLYLNIYDFLCNDHIRYIVNHIIEDIFEKHINIKFLESLNTEIFDKLYYDKNILDKFGIKKYLISKIIDERKVLDYNTKTYGKKNKNITE